MQQNSFLTATLNSKLQQDEQAFLADLQRASVLADEGSNVLEEHGFTADEYTLFLFRELFYRNQISASELVQALWAYQLIDTKTRAHFLVEFMAAVRPSHFALLRQKPAYSSIPYLNEFIHYGIEAYLAKGKEFSHKNELESYAELVFQDFYIEHIHLHDDFTADLSIYVPVEGKYHHHVSIQTEIRGLVDMLRHSQFASDELHIVNRIDQYLRKNENNGCFISLKEEMGRTTQIQGFSMRCKSQPAHGLVAA